MAQTNVHMQLADTLLIKVAHVYAWAMSRMHEPCHICMSHVTYAWAMSYMREPCHVCVSHVTYAWAMSHMHELCHMCRIRITYGWVSDVTYAGVHMNDRPTQSIMYIPFRVNRFQKSILLIVPYKYSKSCSEDFFLKNPTKIWSSTQDHAALHLLLNTVGFFISARQKSAWWKWFVPQLYQLRRGILEGPALKYFYMIHRVRRVMSHVWMSHVTCMNASCHARTRQYS